MKFLKKLLNQLSLKWLHLNCYFTGGHGYNKWHVEQFIENGMGKLITERCIFCGYTRKRVI